MIGHLVKRALAAQREESLQDFSEFCRQQRHRIRQRCAQPTRTEIRDTWGEVDHLYGRPYMPREAYDITRR